MSTKSTFYSDPSFEERQFQANMQYNLLLGAFQSEDEFIFPEYYAGAYLNYDGYMVVMVTDMVSSTNIEYLKQITENDDLLIETGSDFSYAGLLEYKNQIENYYLQNDNAISRNIKGITVYNESNNIEVTLENASIDDISAFARAVLPATFNAQNFTTPIFFSEEAPGSTVEFVGDNTNDSYALNKTVCPGSKIHTESYNSSAGMWQYVQTTVGVACTKNGQNGFITSGHNLKTGQTVCVGDPTVSKTNIGTVSAKQTSGNVDAAFIKTDSNCTVNPDIFIGEIEVDLGGTISLLESTRIEKYGSRTEHREGTIISTNDTFTGNDGGTKVTITDLYKVEYTDAERDSSGDSDGPIWYSSGSRNYIVGICTSEKSSTTGNVCKIENITSKLGVTITLS